MSSPLTKPPLAPLFAASPAPAAKALAHDALVTASATSAQPSSPCRTNSRRSRSGDSSLRSPYVCCNDAQCQRRPSDADDFGPRRVHS